MKRFKAHTGTLGGTEPGQRVTAKNAHLLPPGCVVRVNDEEGSRLIHLHDNTWLWCCDGAWTYDRIENLTWRLTRKSELCHHS